MQEQIVQFCPRIIQAVVAYIVPDMVLPMFVSAPNMWLF